MSYTKRESDIEKNPEPVATKDVKAKPELTSVGGIVGKAAQGEIPSNQDINSSLEQTKETLDAQKKSKDLDSHGKQLVQDTKEVLESVQSMINEKNKDEKIQKFMQASVQASKDANMNVTANVDAQGVQRDVQQLYVYARDLALYLVKSGDFRSMLIDFIDLTQNFLLSATEKISTHIAEPMKQDIASGDTSMSSTQFGATQLKEEAKEKTYVDERKRQEFLDKFSNLLRRLSEKPEYSMAVNKMFKLVDSMSWNLQSAAQSVKENESVNEMWKDAKSILVEFSSKAAVDNFANQLWNLYDLFKNDTEANCLIKAWKQFISDALENPDNLTSESKKKEARELADRSWNLFQKEKFRYQTQKVFDAARAIIECIQKDSSVQDLTARLQKLGKDFGADSQGKPDLLVIQDSLMQMKNVLIPVITKQFENVSIPKIEGSSDTYDFCIENLTFAAGDLLPEKFQLKTKGDLEVNIKKIGAEKVKSKILLSIDNICPKFKDIKFHYKRKKFPKIEDYGVVDVDLSTGSGLHIQIIWALTYLPNKPAHVALKKVKCSVDKMNIHIQDAKHEILDKMAIGLFTEKIKRAVAQEVVNGIVNAIKPLNDKINQFFESQPLQRTLESANVQMKQAYTKGLEQKQQTSTKTKVDKLKKKAEDTVSKWTHSWMEQTQKLPGINEQSKGVTNVNAY
jgi:hypothetical protein